MDLTNILAEHREMILQPYCEINSYYNRRLYRLAMSLRNQKEAVHLIRNLLDSGTIATFNKRFYHISTIFKLTIYFISSGIISEYNFTSMIKKKIDEAKIEVNLRLNSSTDHIPKLYLRNRLVFLDNLNF